MSENEEFFFSVTNRAIKPTPKKALPDNRVSAIGQSGSKNPVLPSSLSSPDLTSSRPNPDISYHSASPDPTASSASPDLSSSSSSAAGVSAKRKSTDLASDYIKLSKRNQALEEEKAINYQTIVDQVISVLYL